MENDKRPPASTLSEQGMSPRVAEVIHGRQSAAELHAWAGHVKGLSTEEAHAKADLRQAEADRQAPRARQIQIEAQPEEPGQGEKVEEVRGSHAEANAPGRGCQ